MNQRPLREVVWGGDSKERLKEFPQDAQRHIGHALGYAQHGGKHHTAKPLKGFGSGVFEIVENYRGETYRLLYAVQVGEPIYVLHAFQKKSTKGIKTPKKELELIKQRLKMAQEKENERSTI